MPSRQVGSNHNEDVVSKGRGRDGSRLDLLLLYLVFVSVFVFFHISLFCLLFFVWSLYSTFLSPFHLCLGSFLSFLCLLFFHFVQGNEDIAILEVGTCNRVTCPTITWPILDTSCMSLDRTRPVTDCIRRKSCIIQTGKSEFKSLYRAGPTPLSIKGSTIFNLP